MPANLTQLYFRRQLLHSSTKVSTPLEVADSICGINAQRGVTIYLSCWNRISHFEKKDLDRALYTTKELVKMWCMRGTVHIIPSHHFHIYQRATDPSRLWLPDIPEEFCKKIINVLDEPLTKSEITDRITDTTNRKLQVKVGRTVRMLGYKGIIVFANPLGKEFYFREYKFVLAKDWLSHIDSITEEEARKILFLNYLKCYGPARIQDFAYWAGFKVGEARNILKSVDVNQLRIDGKSYYMTGRTSDHHHNDTTQNHEIVLLPEYDSYVMGHKYKSRILKESYRQQVFLPYAAVAATIVKDGAVIGTWKAKKGKNALAFEITPFETIDESCMNNPLSNLL